MSVEQELKRFASTIVKESKTSLTKKKKNVSKSLYNSIDYDLKVSKNSFSLSFIMAEHGKFIDKGVKGAKSSAKAPKSPYSYKKGIENRPSPKHFDKWVVKRGLAGRDKKGKFISRSSIKYAIATAVQNYGIETTNFFTKPFESAFKRLPEELTQQFGLEVEDFLKFSLK